MNINTIMEGKKNEQNSVHKEQHSILIPAYSNSKTLSYNSRFKASTFVEEIILDNIRDFESVFPY